MRVLLFVLLGQLILPATSSAQSSPGAQVSPAEHPYLHAPESYVTKVDFAALEPYLHRKSDTVYIVNFWATWCGPCREELPDLEQIHRDHTAEKVKVLLVSLDFPSAADKSLISFIRDNDITADVVLLDDPDANAWIDKVDPTWSGALPATLVYSQDKRLFFGKAVNYEIIDNAVSALSLP